LALNVSPHRPTALPRHADVGRDKATVAAEFINSRVPGCNVKPHFARIEDFDSNFYRRAS
jgi:ubiquitin-activating enzyme E1 C